MQIQIDLIHQPIEAMAHPELVAPGQAGAVVEFNGRVRAEENGKRITALEYEAYTDMATHIMRQRLEKLSALHPCLAAQVVHRLGVVPVGEAAIRVKIWSQHRSEGFALLGAFMDQLKQDVPIWKTRAILAEPAPE